MPKLGFLKEKATRELPLSLLPGLPCQRRGHGFLHLPSSWSHSSDVTQIPCCWEERDTRGNTEPATKRGVLALCAASEALRVSVCFQKPGAGESQNTETLKWQTVSWAAPASSCTREGVSTPFPSVPRVWIQRGSLTCTCKTFVVRGLPSKGFRSFWRSQFGHWSSASSCWRCWPTVSP